MSTPLFSAVEGYIAKERARFHMPGHKGQPLPVVGDAARYDITEVQGAGSLYEAGGPIAETERRFAALYGAKGTLLSAGGSTLCIQAMLALAAAPGSKIIAGRGVHTATINAMALLDLHPVWVFPEADPATALPLAITAGQVARALQETPDAACVYLTSPDYFGAMSDIAAVADVCRAHGVPLLVDNAHGAHLAFLEPFAHPITLGADMCCDSLHKTLPVLTGGAVLHIAKACFLGGAKRAMALFGSTSPSYLVMLSADTVLPYLENGIRADMALCAERMASLKQMASALGYAMPGGLRETARLTLDFGSFGYTAEEYGKALRECGIEPEYLAGRCCVLMAGCYTPAEDYNRLEQALKSIPARAALPPPEPGLSRCPERVLSVREAVFAKSMPVPVDKALGRTAGAAVSPCPPGIPVVVPGEKMDAAVLRLLKNSGISHINVL